MILLCGIPSEPPLALVIEAVQALGVPYVVFNQRHFANASMLFEIQGGHLSGWLEIDGSGYPLEHIEGVYIRLMDYQMLPEFRELPEHSEHRRYAASLHEALTRWAEITPARVVNRMAPMASNGSKPFQAQLIQPYGFAVPETLITTDPDEVKAFRARHGRIIYKSISGVRSIVQVFSDDDLDRLERVRVCPTQFQACVEGPEVRVHVVGDEVFATQVHSQAIDYRYARQQVGEAAVLEPITLSPELAERCVRLSQGLGLAFSGIDLRLSPDGLVYCFEVNPCPGYSYYEANTGQPISAAVARYLAHQPSAANAPRQGMLQAACP
jgi:glutathione synthase/RimK-type ligase-like ATP-grasp enzyme